MDGHTPKIEESASGHRARLRKRLLDAGPAGFHDYELVEYLLTLTIPRVDTKPIAKKLIAQFGGIGPLLSASAETLKREGLSDATVGRLVRSYKAGQLERILGVRLLSSPERQWQYSQRLSPDSMLFYWASLEIASRYRQAPTIEDQ